MGNDRRSGSAGPKTFDSKEDRDAWQLRQYGHARNAFREPDEPTDGRPVLVRAPFWHDGNEQAVYEAAVSGNPIKPGEGPFTYIRRISALVTGEAGGIGSMPRRRMSQREWERKQWEVKRVGAGYFRDPSGPES
jgi:hypothetical protein